MKKICIECKKKFESWENEYGETIHEFCKKCQKERNVEDAWLVIYGYGTINKDGRHKALEAQKLK